MKRREMISHTIKHMVKLHKEMGVDPKKAIPLVALHKAALGKGAKAARARAAIALRGLK